jgi:hypothetical protein
MAIVAGSGSFRCDEPSTVRRDSSRAQQEGGVPAPGWLLPAAHDLTLARGARVFTCPPVDRRRGFT